jgi:hypothetical protein
MTTYPYHLSIVSSISTDYDIMGKGLTDAICILGFADCNDEYYGSAYQVVDLVSALTTFSDDGVNDSSLVCGLLEAYTAGCRDIWLYPIAPMSAYVAPGNRDSSYWTALYDYYTSALSVLEHYDAIDVLIPYDADIEEEEDFVAQFAAHCQGINGALRLTYFSYQGDETASFLGEDFHIILVNGLGTFHFPEWLGTNYSSGMATTFAATVSRLSTEVPPDNRLIESLTIFNSDYLDTEDTLEANQIVGFRKTATHKRVLNAHVVSTLSYTRAVSTESDYLTLYAVHTVQRFLRAVDKLGLIGVSAYIAQDTLDDLFGTWEQLGYVNYMKYSMVFSVDTLYVDVTLVLPYPVGSVDLALAVGPVF